MEPSIITVLLFGGAIMQLIYIFAYSFFFNKKAHIYFLLYSLAGMSFIFLMIYPEIINKISDYGIILSPIVKNVFIFLSNGFFYLFIDAHLNGNRIVSVFKKIITISAYVLFMTGGILLVFELLGNTNRIVINFCYTIFFLNFLVQAFVVINLILRRNIHARIIAIGYLLMFIIVKTSLLTELDFFHDDIQKISKYILVAINIQFIFFTFSLVYKFWKDEKEKTKIQSDREQDLLKQRIEIGNDLHDNLGSTLSSLYLYSSIALKHVDENSIVAKTNLENISKVTQTVMNQINDVIWSISSQDTNVSLLSTRIKDYFVDVFDSSNIKCIYNVDDEAELSIVGVKARKNILLITKEAINNAVKYSKADLLKFSILQEGKNIKLSIEDNGIGIGDPNFNKGHGLNNMMNRTKELEGFFSIKNIEPNGTLVDCIFPLTSIRV